MHNEINAKQKYHQGQIVVKINVDQNMNIPTKK